MLPSLPPSLLTAPAPLPLPPPLQLFPTIDTNHDGVISAEELQRHLLANGLTISRRRAEAEWRETDTNHDGRVSPLEYLDIHLDDTEYQRRAAVTAGYLPDPLDYGNYIDVTRMAIHHADINRDGGLGREEFFNSMNPEGGWGWRGVCVWEVRGWRLVGWAGGGGREVIVLVYCTFGPVLFPSHLSATSTCFNCLPSSACLPGRVPAQRGTTWR